MVKQLFRSAMLAAFLIMSSCSGGDDAQQVQTQNADISQLIGKWIIYRAEYGDSEPLLYESDGTCGREILEFSSDGEVKESLYIDEDCYNGGIGYYTWWILNGQIVLGAQNSYHHNVSITGSQLIVDATEEAGHKKYYNKVN